MPAAHTDQAFVVRSPSMKSNSPTEIVHLGGSRVGTPTEPELSAPDRSKSVPDQRMTRWTFRAPPPEPPGAGIMRAMTDPSELIEEEEEEEEPLSPADTERPITQWFLTEWVLPEGSPTTESPDELLLTASPGLTTAPLNVVNDRQDSPLIPSSLVSPSSFTSPGTLSPFPSGGSSTYSSSSNTSAPRQRSLQPPSTPTGLRHPHSGYSVSRSPSSREPTRDSQPKDPSCMLRRTQSHADIQKRSQWKALPRPPLEESDEEAQDLRSARQHVGQMAKPTDGNTAANSSTGNHANGLRIFPPPTSGPPRKPLPAVSSKMADAQGKPRDRSNSSRLRSTSSESTKGRSSPRQTSTPEKGSKQKLTGQERLWLHRNYRGEATFLKAWGLHITKEEDREEGIKILRELMSGESEDERREQAYRARTESASVAQTLPPTEAKGLDVIVEERNSRELRYQPRKESLGYQARAGDQELWKNGRDHDSHRLMIPIKSFKASRLDKHSRSESESSVLGAYLDIRMSRLD
ncbi:hypothetical protein F5Y15DRAFT_382494 [Xylariaceae sp. FL0016]|nr:hypothetical protein F5Y15DRAFT_382494 [Xylariaceae sp. FL0016]